MFAFHLIGMYMGTRNVPDNGNNTKYMPLGGWLAAFLIIQNVHKLIAVDRRESNNVQLPTSDDLSSSCASKPDGFYPDFEQACRMFFVCSGGKRLATFWCVRGYVFSQSVGRCEPPGRAICKRPNNNSTEECSLGDGIFPDFRNNCSSFHVCKGGVKTTFICPPSTAFDWRTQTCKDANQVQCQKLNCSGKKNGFYPDLENNCKRYVHCVDGDAVQRVCPDGQLFNSRTNRCSNANTTLCPIPEKNKCLGVPDGFYPNHEKGCKTFDLCLNSQLKAFNCPAKTLFNSNSISCEETAECHVPKFNMCRGKSNGAYPDYNSGCRNFYVCLDERVSKVGTCPLGKILDPVTEICEPTVLVSCSLPKDSDCDGKEDGVYADHNSGCSAFFLCINGRKVVKNYCEGNGLYDKATGRCLPSAFVSCTDESRMTFTPRLLHSYDCSNRIGIYPEFSQNCKRFSVCANNHETMFECPQGKSFDAKSNTCLRSGTIPCDAPSVVSVFQCLPADQGIYAGPLSNQWYECRRGVGFIIECPAGQFYHGISNKCIPRDAKPSYIMENTTYVTKPASEILQVNIFEDENLIFDCSSKPNGLYKSGTCGVFHICAEGSLSSFYCPYEMVFDLEISQCQYDKNSSSCETEEQKVSQKFSNFDCEKVPDGMYADYSSDCHRYFVCEGGNTVLVYCPERQKFSSTKMICEDENSVTCNPHKLPSPDNNTTTTINLKDLIYHVEGRIGDVSPDTVVIGQHEGNRKTTEDKSDKSNDTVLVEFRKQQDARASSHQNNTLKVNSTAVKQSPPKRISPNQKENRIHDTTTESAIGMTVFINSYHKLPSTSPSSTTVPTGGSWSTPCPNGDTGFFADYESNCKNFHICFRTIRKTYSCPSVLLFNPDTKHCDLPENVVCKRPIALKTTEYDCSKIQNQFEPDFSSGCRNFIGCTNNIPYRFQCPERKLFNPESRRCESSVVVRCNTTDGRSKSNTGFMDIDHQSSVGGHDTPFYTHPSNSRNYFDCSRRMDGFYADFARHCHVFYRCVRGKKFSHYCKQGLLFNPKSGICDFEENVICSNDSEDPESKTS